MVGSLSDSEIDSFLSEQSFGHLGCHANGKTYVVPISYVLDGGRLISQTTTGRKIHMMRANPEVCFAVDAITDLIRWKSVILDGRFQELTGADAAGAMRLLIDKFGPVFQEMASPSRLGREVGPPRLDGKLSAGIVFCIHILEKSGRFESPD